MALRALQIFKAGTHIPESGEPVTFSRNDLQQIALDYSPQVRVANLVLGHPSVETENFGRVQSLAAHADALYAFAEVKDQLIELVRRCLYRTVSASFLRPRQQGNPLPDGWYLNHVGFLGAHPPAVKNMQPISFAEGGAGALNFSAPPGCTVSAAGLRLYRLALDIQSADPGISFIAAASLAERAISR